MFLPFAVFYCVFLGCHSQNVEGVHTHDSEGNHIKPPESTLKAQTFTVYSEKTELFVEFKPLVVGNECRFAAHFTVLGDVFKAMEEGSITLSLTGNASTQSITATKPEVPGIFRLRMTPEKSSKNR